MVVQYGGTVLVDAKLVSENGVRRGCSVVLFGLAHFAPNNGYHTLAVPAQVSEGGAPPTWTAMALPSADKLASDAVFAGIGSSAAVSGSLVIAEGNSTVDVFLHCGGYVAEENQGHTTDECFVVELGTPGGTPVLKQFTPLPYSLEGACHGSDGQRVVVAGGWSAPSNGSIEVKD